MKVVNQLCELMTRADELGVNFDVALSSAVYHHAFKAQTAQLGAEPETAETRVYQRPAWRRGRDAGCSPTPCSAASGRLVP